ncbi:MAG TPA: rhodanese-like domain-containing protein [Verrucomicrobiae bacterium]|nr:rhodanese-like domain-containing protein [Verrucomicrobiae bacterium]
MAVPEKSAAVVLFCGRGFRSALAAGNLRKMGCTNCISMNGGLLQVLINLAGTINDN